MSTTGHHIGSDLFAAVAKERLASNESCERLLPTNSFISEDARLVPSFCCQFCCKIRHLTKTDDYLTGRSAEFRKLISASSRSCSLHNLLLYPDSFLQIAMDTSLRALFSFTRIKLLVNSLRHFSKEALRIRKQKKTLRN